MRYLLDTNACIDFIRDTGGIRERMKRHALADFAISSIVYAELMHGAKQSPHPDRNLNATQNFCLKLNLLSFDAAAAEAFANVRMQLENEGQRIGAYDMLIAAHAISLGLTCISSDGALQRVRGLKLENWRNQK